MSVAKNKTTAPPVDQDVTVESERITASDGYDLAIDVYRPQTSPRAAVLLAGGTGIPQYFYAAFATHLARQGYIVLTFDHRGIGRSKPETLRGFHASKLDWARLDQSAALAALQARAPGLPLGLFGHSLGGQLLGLVDGIEDVDAIVTYGTGFGYWGNMPRPYKYFVWSLWYVAVPALPSPFGYLPASRLGLGEDLPSAAARDWARWGKRADYFLSEFEGHPGFDRVRAPWVALLATDDQIATPANSMPLYRRYRYADVRVQPVRPEDHGHEELGHMAFFSRKRQRAWVEVTSRLQDLLGV